MVQKYCDSRRQILEGNRKESERSSGTTRGRLEKREEGITLKEKDIYS